jgi:hypothetical protein
MVSSAMIGNMLSADYPPNYLARQPRGPLDTAASGKADDRPRKKLAQVGHLAGALSGLELNGPLR